MIVVFARTQTDARRTMERLSLNPHDWIYPTDEWELRGIASVQQIFVEGWHESVLQGPSVALMAQIRNTADAEPLYLERVPEFLPELWAEQTAREELARRNRLAHMGSPFIDPSAYFPTLSKPRPWWQRIIRRFTHGR